MNSKNLVNYSSDEFNNLSQFQQEEITNNFKEAILYKMKEKNLHIDEVSEKSWLFFTESFSITLFGYCKL